MAPDIEAGRTYRVVTGVPGKSGIVYTLDRETGRFLWARPTLMQNLVQSIDGATGRVTLNPDTVPTAYGQSITDGCVGWETTVELLEALAGAAASRSRAAA